MRDSSEKKLFRDFIQDGVENDVSRLEVIHPIFFY